MAEKTLDLGISKLYTLLRQHYEAYPVDDLRAQWGVPEDSADPEPAAPMPVVTMLERLRQTRGEDFDYTAYQTTQIQPAAGFPSTASSAHAICAVWGVQFVGLNTHKLILGVFFDAALLHADWPAQCDKTFPQFMGLPNTDGTVGTEVAPSLAGSSARGSKHSLDFDEGALAASSRVLNQFVEAPDAVVAAVPVVSSI